MKIESYRDISENEFFNFYFLNLDDSIIIYATNLRVFSIHIKNITAEGTDSDF